MTPLERTIATLRGAKSEIQRNGWCQHQLQNGAGNVCVLGAIYRAQCYPIEAPATRELQQTVNDLSLANWNDTPGRTKEEVLAAIDATIARLEAQAS